MTTPIPSSGRQHSTIAVALACVAALVAGCGTTQPDPDPAFIVAVDGSRSTDDDRGAYVSEIEDVALIAADARAAFYVDIFGGEPTSTVTWDLQQRFGSYPPDLGGNPELEADFDRARAKELASDVEARLLSRRSAIAGTPLGESLDVIGRQCASLETTCRIYWLTDAIFVEEGIDVRRPIDTAERRAFIKRWSPRLRALKGAEVTFVRVGLGARARPVALERSRALVDDLLASVNARVAGWNVDIATPEL